MAAVASVEAVPFAFARGLGVEIPEEGEVMEHVVRRMGRQRRLVVVDNCEHLLDAAGGVIEQLLGACPNTHVLATSREPVMVRGERLSAVPSLNSDDAYGLFVERATAEAPGLVLDKVQTQAAVELCERLDRLPLAIELVASRLRAQTPVELLAAIDERLRLLVGGRRSRMERHQTMRGALDWSYDLCDPLEQEVFDRLSVFAAGFDLDAAVAVACPDSVDEGEVADAVMRLVDRSLLSRTQGVDGRSRFRLLETMRAYGREHLQSAEVSDEVRRRHADWVASESAGLPEAWYGPDPAAAEARIRTLVPDIVTALDWRLDRRDWTSTPGCFLACFYAEPGLFVELVDRVWIAADDAGETDRLPAVAVAQNHALIDRKEISHSDIKRRALTEIRNGSWRTGADPTTRPPHIALADLTLTPTEATEVRASLRDLGELPVYMQFVAHHFAAAPLARSLDQIDDVLDEVDRLANIIGGPHAIGQAHGTRGWVASRLGDWNGCIQHHEEALKLLPASYANTIGIRADILLCRVLTDRQIRSDDIRVPWRQMRDLDIEGPAGFLAYCTGVALAYLGHVDIAQSFFACFQARRPEEQHPMHGAVRERFPKIAALVEVVAPEDVTIDRITDAAFTAADSLDAAGGSATTSA
jgi:predicted ATPase